MGGGREVQEGGKCVFLQLIHVDIWQKPMQYCKAVILQLKINEISKGDVIKWKVLSPIEGTSYVNAARIRVSFSNNVT